MRWVSALAHGFYLSVRDRYPSLVSVSLSWFSILLLHGCTLTIITLTRCYAVLSSNRMENCPNHRSKPIWATSSVTCNPAIATTCLKSSKPICRKNNRTSTTTSSVTTWLKLLAQTSVISPPLWGVPQDWPCKIIFSACASVMPWTCSCFRTTRTTQSKTLPERRASRQCAPSTAISANW